MTATLVVLRYRGSAGERRADTLTRLCLEAGFRQQRRSQGSIVLAMEGTFDCIDGVVLHGRVHGDSASALRHAAADPIRAAERLVRACWGSYLAVFSSPEETLVVADPSGSGRGHVCADTELTILADVLTPALLRTAGFTPTIRDDVLAGGLIDPPTLILASAIEGMRTLAPGTATSLGWPVSETPVWKRPTADPALTSEECVSRLVEAVDGAVGSIRSKLPLIQLSGGLDSAIVLSSAATRGPAIALTVVGESGDADESRYAKDAAALADVQLIVARDGELPSFDAFMQAEQIAHPYLHGLDDVFDRRMAEAVRLSGCDSIITGQGGDAVFLQPAATAISIDRFLDLGIGGLRRGILDDATRLRTSIWSPLGAVMRHLIRGTEPLRPAPLTPHLLCRSARMNARRIQHPWTRDPDPDRPGLELRTRLLANAQVVHTRRPRTSSIPMFNPLLDQPVLEAVLAMPAWRLATGPMDRGLARRAFAGRLPGSILRRSSKGQASAHFSRGVTRNLPLLRERLLDGQLVARRILDPMVLEQVLSADHLAHSTDFRSLMFVASCEAWATAWR